MMSNKVILIEMKQINKSKFNTIVPKHLNLCCCFYLKFKSMLLLFPLFLFNWVLLVYCYCNKSSLGMCSFHISLYKASPPKTHPPLSFILHIMNHTQSLLQSFCWFNSMEFLFGCFCFKNYIQCFLTPTLLLTTDPYLHDGSESGVSDSWPVSHTL